MEKNPIDVSYKTLSSNDSKHSRQKRRQVTTEGPPTPLSLHPEDNSETAELQSYAQFYSQLDKYHNASSTTLRPIRQETQKERNFSLKTITRTGDFSFRVVRQKFQIIDDLQLL